VNAKNATRSLWQLKHEDGVPYARSLPSTLIYWPQPGLSDDASRSVHEEAMREAAAALDALDRFYATGIVPHHVLDVLAAWDEEYLWHRVDLYLDEVGCDGDAAGPDEPEPSC
jgi:hypothetical protein